MNYHSSQRKAFRVMYPICLPVSLLERAAYGNAIGKRLHYFFPSIVGKK